MNSISITVEAESLDQALAMLSLQSLSALEGVATAVAGLKSVEPSEDATTTDKVEEPAAEVEEATTEAATPEAPVIALEDVRAKLTELTRAGKQPAVKELIESFGVSKLTDIPSEKYPEVLEKVKEIA